MDRESFKYAFQKTIPVLFGYLFLGSACGLVLFNAGYNFIWVFFISLFVYAGSGQMLLASLLAVKAPFATVAVLTLLLNSRHAFYGLSFIDRFKNAGSMYPYMIFSLTDETYSILCSTHTPVGINDGRVIKAIAFLDHSYWLAGCVFGALMGQLLSFNFKGVDFAMTALFVVIFIEQWESFKSHVPVYAGVISALLCILIFGTDNFILPSLIITVGSLMVLRHSVEPASKEALETCH
ncbi:AzlC family ABC transporter permease [Lachnospiraceae bacterium NSJ-143]|nr:AzlC family ABC transporter permease [Lachnospiraceae bacterium NSJ-143]